MRVFLALCLCATAFAVPQGYNYQQQPSSLPVPNLSFIQEAFKSTKLSSALGGQLAPTQQFSAAPQFNQPAQQQHSFIQSQQPQQQTSFTPSFGGQQQFAQQYQASAPITKDIYVHVAPEEQEQSQYQQQLPQAPPRKHYRIVFIKAPTPKINAANLRVSQAPVEEKTIIYVLTKKPDPLDLQAAIQDAQPKQPSKPEVYFIKYKTQEEAQHAQRTIQAQYDKLGGTTQISDEGIAPVTSVIGSLDGQQSRGGSSQHSHSASSHSSSSASNASNYLPPIVKK